MTSPTIPPQPEPERVCGNCRHFDRSQVIPTKGICEVHAIEEWSIVPATHTCVLFRARKES